MGDNPSKEYQIQTQINQQKVALKQDQNASNTILCKLLAELENLVIFTGYKEKIYFDFYATKGQKKDEIINQIVFQMIIFESSYKNFIKNNPKKKYEFPSNLTFEEIISLINFWKNFLNKDKSNASLIKYYDSFLNILNGKNLDKGLKEEFSNLDKNSKPTTEKDLKRMLNAGTIATSLTNEKNKEIEKEIIEKGNYDVKVNIGGKREDNKFYHMIDKNEENFKKLKKEIFNSLEIAIGYLELYYHLLSDNKFKYPGKNEKIKKDIYEKYEKYKDEFLTKISTLSKNYDYEFFMQNKEKLGKVKNDLEIWKSNVPRKLKLEFSNAINVFCLGLEDSIN